MQLDWSTVVLEILNFLVLIWILKRFLYRPILDIIARRKAGIDAAMEKAEATRSEADSLKQQYERRLADWENERARAREALRQEIDKARRDRLAALQAELDAQREKGRVADERRLADAQRHGEQMAIEQGARFASKLLAQLCGAELDDHLVRFAVDALRSLSHQRVEQLRQNHGGIASDRSTDRS